MILVAAPADAGTRSAWIPSTTTTQGTAAVSGNTVSGRSTSTTSGGFYVDKPWAQYEAALHAMSSGNVVWIASMTSRGNAFADWGDLARSMAKETSEQLLKDGVVK